MKIKFFFILFSFYSICYSSIVNIFDSMLNLISYNKDNSEFIKLLVNEMLKEISNVTFESNEEDNKCFNALTQNLKTTKKLFSACGKYLGDFGFEDICEEINIQKEQEKDDVVNYFLLNFTLVIPLFNVTSQYNELHFLNESKSIMGLCLYNCCMKFFNKFINEDNVKFINFINETTGIKNGKLGFVTNDIIDKKIEKNGNDFWLFWFFFILTSVWFIFLIIYFFIKICQNKENKKIIISNENINELENKDDEYIEFKNKNQNNEKEEMKDFKYKLNQILSACEITKMVEKLFTVSNDLYNNKGLESLAFIRCFVAFFIIYYYTFYALIYFPPKDQFNPNFFTHFSFFFIRLSGMSFICYIILDGTVMSFKLMCKIRNYFIYEVHSEISIILFLKFFCNSFSNMFIFFFIFGFFYNCSIYFNYKFLFTDSKNWLNLGFLFNYYSQYFLIEENNEIFLTKNFHEILYIPFKYVKESFSFYKNLNDNNITDYSIMKSFTYDFVYISINEFYSFIIALILIYLCCYLRLKLFDICLFIIMIIYFFLSIIYFGFTTVQNNICDIKYKMIINQDWFEKNPILFQNVYFIGVIIGIIYFYYKDLKSNVQLYNYYDNTDNEYSPFNLCANFVRFIIPINNSLKKIILFFSIIFIVLISCDFNIFIYLNNNDTLWSIYNENENPSKKNIMIYFYHFTYYSKVFFIFFFSLILILLLTLSKSDFFYSLIHLKFINFLERESRVILCCSQAVLLLCVCAFRYQFILEHTAFFIHSIGIYLFILLVSTIITIFIEIPIKEIIKYFTRTLDWELYYSKELTNEISEDNFLLLKDFNNDKLIIESKK